MLAAVLTVVVAVYGSTRPAPPLAPPQSGVVVSYDYLPMSQVCGASRVEAHVRLNNGEVVLAGSSRLDTIHSGMRVTVENRSPVCVATPYAIIRRGPPNSSLQRTPNR